MKRLFVALMSLVLFSAGAGAVVKEKNMDLTVKRLHSDLQNYEEGLDYSLSQYEKQRIEYWTELEHCMHECQEYSIVLYTQQEDWLFGLSQACQNLETLMEDFQKNQHPFEKWKGNFDSEIERYRRLEELLSRIRTQNLTEKGEEARLRCIEICEAVRGRLTELQKEIYSDNDQYEEANNRIEEMAQYNTERFEAIRRRVFLSRGDSFIHTVSHFKESIEKLRIDVSMRLGGGRVGTKAYKREHRTVRLVFVGSLLLAILMGCYLGYRLIPSRYSFTSIREKRRWVAFAFVLGFFTLFMYLSTFVFMQGFQITNSVRILLELPLIVMIIVMSVTLRLDRDEIRTALHVYEPLFMMTFVFVVERVQLVSNSVVNLSLPIILLVSTVWQFVVLLKHGHKAERLVSVLLWVSFLVTFAMCVFSWVGYNFLALLLMIYWIILLACFQTVICLRYVQRVTERLDSRNNLKNVWIDPTIDKLVIPVLSILSFKISVPWAARIFSMSTWAKGLLTTNFVSVENGFTASLNDLLLLLVLAFAVRWGIFMLRTLLKSIYKETYNSGPIPLYMTLGSIFIWFLYAVVAIKILGINSSGLVAAVGGMGVGVGFALKDTIENLFCGISLLMGRVHINDIIECDGVRGRITDIGIRSTTVETLDGSIISFLNSQLFAKNFKNLTKNHKYELCIVKVGVSYGTSITKTKAVIQEALGSLQDSFAPGKNIMVQLSDFGDSSVDLDVKVWLPIRDKAAMMSQIREAIYNAFNENGIEIPFPQTDLHVKQISDLQGIQ